MAPDRLGHDDREALRILNRAADGSVMPRAADAASEDDWTERWGRRIGAVLGPVLVVLAALWFVWHLAVRQPPA